jgi:hypothetical protein
MGKYNGRVWNFIFFKQAKKSKFKDCKQSNKLILSSLRSLRGKDFRVALKKNSSATSGISKFSYLQYEFKWFNITLFLIFYFA